MDIVDVADRTEITSLGAKGDGLADGIAVPLSLPGDVIVAGKIIVPSPHRVEPVCPHFGTCGGCALQHASDGFLADWKRGIVSRALQSRDLPADIRAVHMPLVGSRRRAVFSGRRTKKTVLFGFHMRRSDEIIGIDVCPLLRPEIVTALPALRDIVRLAATRKSVVRLGVTAGPAGLDLDVQDARVLDASQIEALARYSEVFARIGWNGDVVALRDPPAQIFGNARVAHPLGAFLQATDEGEALLVTAVTGALSGARKIVELFAGCGTFTLPLLEVSDVHAFEFDTEMLAAMDAGWRSATGLKQLTTEARDLFRRPVLSSEFKGVDAVLLDPPRAGAAAQVAEIAASKVSQVAYVSCNPVTFARDASVLTQAGFTLNWVEVVDQFRWSTHVELVSHFSR